MESTSNEGKGVHLQTFEDRDAEALQERGWRSRTRSDSDRGRIRSKHRTTVPPRSTHMQPGDVSCALIQQGRGTGWGRLHPAAARRRGGDGVAVLRQGFAKLLRRRRGVGKGRGCALDVVCIPPLAPLYIGEEGRGPAPSR